MVQKFEFNSIYVIESLPESETQTGTILYDDLIKRIGYKIDFLKTFHIKVTDKIELFTELEKIKAYTDIEVYYPFLHFEVHGSEEGLVLASKELVSWRELTNRFREINIIIKNNLFVSFATCYSAYIFGAVLPSQLSPFFGFIGTWKTISQGDLMQSYYDFFDIMLNTNNLPNTNFQDTVKKLNENNEVNYHFYSSEQIFNRVISDYNENLNDKEVTERRIEYLIDEAYKHEEVKKMPKQLVRKIIEFNLFEMNKANQDVFRRQFLMI